MGGHELGGSSSRRFGSDSATQQLFSLVQLLFTDDEVLQPIAAIVRDLAIDPAMLAQNLANEVTESAWNRWCLFS